MFTQDDSRVGSTVSPALNSKRSSARTAAAIGGLFVFGLLPAGNTLGAALNFDSVPVTDAVAQIDRDFDARITIAPGVAADQNVSFSVPDISEPGARLEAINDLANSLGATYTKTFVISRSTTGGAVLAPAIDAVEAPVVFPGGTVSAEDAIRTVAGVDDATVKFYSPVPGSVTFTSTRMSAAEAAREIADQTHTVWRASYLITARQAANASATTPGEKVIGYTAGGQPIVELPVDTFRAPANPAPAPTPSTAKSTTAAGTGTSTATANAAGTADAAQAANNAYANPYGYNAYGYYPGYYPGYGYGFGYGQAPSAVVIGPGSGVTGFGSTYNPYASSGYGYGYGGTPYGGYGYPGTPYGGGGYGYGGASPYGYAPTGGSSIIGASPITVLPSFGLGSMY